MHPEPVSAGTRALLALAAVALGAVAWWAVLGGGFLLLRAVWPAYVDAEPQKAYTLAMLAVRLLIFSTAIAAASGAAAILARDERLAWLAGLLILILSIPPHLIPGYVWDDYPAWYHVVYLLSILPVAVYSGRWVQRSLPGAFRESAA